MPSTAAGRQDVRLAELVACLSITTDLATGQVLEHGLRRSLLAVWIGQALGLDDRQLSDVYYVALLGTVGCALEGAAFSQLIGDETAIGSELVMHDPTNKLDVATFFLSRAGRGDRPLTRARKVLEIALHGPSQSAIICRDVATQVGDMLDMGPAVREAVGQCHEQWNGKGWPRGLQGEEISLPARLYILAHDIEVFNQARGAEAAIAVVRRRAGKLYDPSAATLFCNLAERLLARLQTTPTWDAVLAAEPDPVRLVSPERFDALAETVANFIDARSSYTLLHSSRVASLAGEAAQHLGLGANDVSAVHRAGLLHDLGRAGIPVALWEKPGALSDADWERMRRHPSLTELILARSGSLGHLGSIAGLHHERLDGSGYRGVSSASLPVTARLLAAADAYQTKLEDRPHRAASTAEAAAQWLRGRSADGAFDSQAVDAVLAAAGHRAPAVTPDLPAGLSERELEVLRLVIRGLSNRQIAEQLVISPKTVGHHIEHIYDKLDVSSRAGATLFALKHGLVGEA